MIRDGSDVVKGIGAELVALDEVRRALEATGGGASPSPWTAGERAALASRADAVPGLAARLAAKSAALKALAHPEGASPSDVEVTSLASGEPQLVLHGPARAAAERLGVARTHLTLTHAERHALAIVLLEDGTA